MNIERNYSGQQCRIEKQKIRHKYSSSWQYFCHMRSLQCFEKHFLLFFFNF